jgi:MFS family permease
MASSKVLSHFGGISRVLANRDYRTYWFGQIANVLGTWITRVAAGVLIFKMTESPGWLGLLGFVHMAPMMVLGPIAGAIADNVGHRRMAIVATAAVMLVLLILSVLTFSGVMTPALLVGLVALLGAVHAFEFPPRQALIPKLVRREDISAAVGMNSTTFNSAAMIGPVIGAAILGFGDRALDGNGAALAFTAHTVATGVLLLALFSLRHRDAARGNRVIREVFADLRRGIAYTTGNIEIRSILLVSVSSAFLLRPYIDLLPGFAFDVFEVGASGLGNLLAASAAGALIVSIGITVRGRAEGLTTLLVWGVALSAIAMVLFATTSNFWFGLAAMAIIGGFANGGAIAAFTLVQHVVDDSYRARVISVHLALSLGGAATGVLVLGAIAEFFGLQFTVAGGALLALVAVAIFGRPLMARRHGIEADHPEETEPALNNARPSEAPAAE